MSRIYLSSRITVCGLVAALAAVMLAAYPTNAADPDPIAEVVLQHGPDGPIHGDTSYPVVATNSSVIEVLYFGESYGCSSGVGSGYFHSRVGSSYVNPYLEFDALNFVGCQRPLGMTMEVSLNPGCTLTVDALPSNQLVHMDLSDTVSGDIDAGTRVNPCVHVAGGNILIGCTMDIYGQTDATFDEANQTLTISGYGLKIVNGGQSCTFIPDDTAIELNVEFAIDAQYDTNCDPIVLLADPVCDLINFRPYANS